jgi:Fe(3+) dicitrate transport protein
VKSILYIILFLAIPFQLIAQNAVIEGKVINEIGDSISFASVAIEGSSIGVMANYDGSFVINGLKQGTYTLIVDALGYEVHKQSISLSDNQHITLSISLHHNSMSLQEIEIIGINSKNGIGNLNEVHENIIYSGKKHEVLVLDSLDANKAQNNPRQILGRIPGMNFSETEGSGFPSNGFGLRGLNPSQSIEMNTRQNGYNITSDIFGYNEAYYNPAMEAVESIEITRGAASLQFGPQFGGVVNFKMKDAPKNKKFEYTTQQTFGSFNMLNSFHSIGGTINKLSYYGYVQYKNTDGWRPNSGYTALTGFGKMSYQATSKLKVGIEYSILRNKIQMPGGLTDQEFEQDSRQSFRTRNWLNSPWNILTGTVDYKLSENTSFSLKSTYLYSQRNLVWKNEDGGPGQADSINPITNTYVSREVQREAFSSITNELRMSHHYSLWGMKNVIALGLRYFYGSMNRKGGGPGSTGSDFNMNLYGGDYEYALTFNTTNIAPFAELLFRPTNRLSITPGFRFEYIKTTAMGYITDGSRLYEDLNKNRYIPLLGIGTQYKTSNHTTLYGNCSQAYRPMDYSSLTPIGVTSKIDPNMKDASGYNADFGWRGTLKNILNFDIGGFYMQYNKRIGILSVIDPITNNTYTLRTNTGNTISKGIETYIEVNPIKALAPKSKFGNISIFNSFAYIDAHYTSGSLDKNGNSLKGNWVEYSPNKINRTGITYSYKSFSITYQYSMTSKSYGDANNTIHSPDAIIGVIPAYKVMDISGTYKIKNYNIKAGVNNIANASYFTKRTDEYPGPGIIPAIGRSFYISFGAKF